MTYEYRLEKADPEEARRVEQEKQAQREKEARKWEDEEEDEPSVERTAVPSASTQA